MKKNLSRTQKMNYATYAVVIIAYAAMMGLSLSGGMSSMMKGMMVPICVYITMALSLNLTVGIMGELSLGHAGFMSVGAFVGTSVAKILEDSVSAAPARLFIAMLVGAICAAIVGFLIGIPVLRLRGDYLAIVTLAFGEIIKSIVTNIMLGKDSAGLHFGFLKTSLEIEPEGRMIIEGAMGIRNITKISTLTAGFILIMITLVIIFNMINSRTGRAVMSIRDNRIAAESVGIDIFKYKITAFTISAAIAGAAGALFGSNYSSVVASKFGFDTSILILVFVVLGGQGNMLGSIIAAAALTILPEALRSFSDYRMLAYAVVLIAVMLVTNSMRFKQFMDKLKNRKSEEKEGE